MHANTPAPPKLSTLHTKPSWLNRAGRVDRSACFVVTAARLWPLVPKQDWRNLVKPSSNAATDGQPQPPGHARAHEPAWMYQDNTTSNISTRHLPKALIDRAAKLTLTARHLWLLHKHEPPKRIAGDHRTTKTNAMRGTGSSPRPQNSRMDSHHDASTNPQISINPNRGVGFSMNQKMLGLDCLWQTTLTIQRIVQHAKLKQHFLACPACSAAAGPRPGGQTTHNPPPGHHPAVGRQCPRAKQQRLPRGMVTKLYLPLCTPQEYNDAQLAELWLRTYCHPNRPWPPAAVQLIERYSELFEGQHGRQLRCRTCLGLRYGEFKPQQSTKRQRVARAAYDSVPLADASCSDKTTVRHRPHPPGQTHPTEQALFLSNLPRLLAPVPDASPPTSPQRRRADHTNRIETLPKAVKEKLYLLFAGNLPAFQKLQQAKQKSEHEA